MWVLNVGVTGGHWTSLKCKGHKSKSLGNGWRKEDIGEPSGQTPQAHGAAVKISGQ